MFDHVVYLTDLAEARVCSGGVFVGVVNRHRDPAEPPHGFVLIALMILLQKLARRCESLERVRSEHIVFDCTDDLLLLIMIDKNKQGKLIVFPHGTYERLTRKAHQ